MTALIVLGAILLFFVFLLSLKATITIAYADEVTLSVRVLCVKIKILPKKAKKGPRSMSKKKAEKLRTKARKKAQKKREAALAKAEAKKQKKEAAKQKPKKSMSEILDIISMIRSIAAEVIRRFFKHLRIDVARVRVKVATGDAATTAVAYGAACTALNILLPVLSEVKNFSLPREEDFCVEPDFLGDTPTLDVKLSFSLRVWHLFSLAFGALSKFLKHQFKKSTPSNHKYK
ncbi:MAG: DUF2953 domain-containing protein [Clostridia bacterium]|nr:DUF2953 domain-containing protein [Clostridia bacterium]